MTVNNVSSAASTAIQTATATGGQALGKEEFLRLLVTQLSNQDPMNPMQGQEFAAQLAQFSSVEQLININESVSAQGEMQQLLSQGINSGVAAGLIGKQVEAAGNQVGWQGEGEVPLQFELATAAPSATLTLRDAAGNVAHTLELKNLKAGRHAIEWNGENDGGARLPQGVYSFEVNAVDTDGNPVAAAPSTRGRVDRVSFGQDGIRLWLGDVSIPMSAVQSVEQD